MTMTASTHASALRMKLVDDLRNIGFWNDWCVRSWFETTKKSLLNVATKDAELAYIFTDGIERRAEDHRIITELMIERRVLERDERKSIADSGEDYKNRRAGAHPVYSRMELPER